MQTSYEDKNITTDDVKHHVLVHFNSFFERITELRKN